MDFSGTFHYIPILQEYAKDTSVYLIGAGPDWVMGGRGGGGALSSYI